MKRWVDGWGGVDGVCVELLSPRGASSASPVPQINSQPASRALTSSLSLSFFLSPSISVSLYLALLLCQRHLLSPCLLPTPTACPATNGAWLSGNLSACLSVCCSACLSLSQPIRRSSCLSAFASVYLSLCMGSCLSICLSACQPLFLANTSLPESSQAAALPICLNICLSIRHLFVSLFVCLLVCLPVYLSACPSVYYLFICLSCGGLQNGKHEPLSPFYSSRYSFQFQKDLVTWQQKDLIKPKSHLISFLRLTFPHLIIFILTRCWGKEMTTRWLMFVFDHEVTKHLCSHPFLH